jgi:hypothetical protein
MRALLPPLLLALAMWPGTPARAQQVNRCTGPDGTTVFSDRRCEDVGALARLPPAAHRDGDAGLYRYGCPRRLSELVAQLRGAIDAHDVNRLSSLYLWSDLSNAAANQVLTRLEGIADRPLLNIAPVYPDSPPTPPASATLPIDPGTGVATAVAPTAARPRPWALRIEQTLGSSATPSRTLLNLRRQYNCFWVSF